MRMYDELLPNKDHIREKAERKYGGTTTIWMVIQQVKKVAQRYQVGEHLTIESTPGRSIKVKVNAKIGRALPYEKYQSFFTDMADAVQDCGYSMAVGDNYYEIHKV